MKHTTKIIKEKGLVAPGKQRNYNDIVEYLDKRWTTTDTPQTLERMQKLDKELGSISKKIDAVLVAGTNGKSLTIHFAAKLLQDEGLKVGAFYSPHMLTYNERLNVNHNYIQNKVFTEIANDVINAAERLGIKASSSELLTMMALLYFERENVDVALFEVDETTSFHPTNICDAKIFTITRSTAASVEATEDDIIKNTIALKNIIKQGTWVTAGDQNKAHLQLMQNMTEERGGQWAMPIRKLAPLSYPFEQLHGRCAALAERIASLYINNFALENATIVDDSLLVKKPGKRGRPTIAENIKRKENPARTIENYWKETVNTLPCRFQLLDKEKPTFLLDNANNIDALNNLLLGIRLLNYQRPIKGLTLVIGATQKSLYCDEFLKVIRYFFKKTTGQVFVCPIEEPLPGTNEEVSWDSMAVANDIKSMKVKAQGFKSFAEAFDAAKDSVDERNGLVVITGSQSIITSYWRHKGIKKLG